MKQCPECGNMRALSSFDAGRGYQHVRCRPCRSLPKDDDAEPIASIDPVRKRACWHCGEPFVTVDFTQRLCSAECRAAHRRQVGA